MESRLPKPSGLKRPACGPNSNINGVAAYRSMVPSDRLNNQHNHNNATTNHQPATALASSRTFAALHKMPLSATDVLNLPATAAAVGAPQKRRCGSPDSVQNRPPPIVRAKMRRSRSASELRTQPNAAALSSRFVGTSLDGMPPKLSKSTTSLRLVTSSLKPKLATIGAGRTAAANVGRAASTTQTSSGRPASAAPLKRVGASAKTTASTTASSSSASSASSGAPPAKKFAPYDYKGRFLDLQERFKAQKEKLEKSHEQMAEYLTLNDQFDQSQTKLFRCLDQLKSEESQTQCLRQQLASQTIKLESLAASVTEKQSEIQRLRIDGDRLRADNAQMRPELAELRTTSGQLTERVAELSDALTDAQESLFRSNMERKELHNVVMDLRGNIRVFCRVRPPLGTEEQRSVCGWQYLDESSLEISTVEGGGNKKPVRHEFSFDQVFHPRSRQEDIFELVSPLIQSALDGYNVCIFAYGQTGSGKTFTMDGVPEDIGIIPRTVDLLFECCRNYRRLGWEYAIKVTFLEIYNEVLYDLLSNDAKDMDIRMVSAKTPTEIYVSNITEVTVNTADELRDLMSLAKSNRATAATAGNERSSRSHAVTRVQLIGRHNVKQETCVGNINLVDLAGSESPKTSTRMEETKKINKSLSELTNVIMALMQRQEHIPYRNSKLTHLLMPCLGGNSKTLMFINVAPFQDCFVESVKSLRFAASVNSCKMAKAKRNKYLNTSGDQPGGTMGQPQQQQQAQQHQRMGSASSTASLS